jgi:hypothetical protein
MRSSVGQSNCFSRLGSNDECPSRHLTTKVSAGSLPPPLLRFLQGREKQLPGGRVSRCGPARFHSVLFRQLSLRFLVACGPPTIGGTREERFQHATGQN